MSRTHKDSTNAARAERRKQMAEGGYFNRAKHMVHRSGNEYQRRPKHKGRSEWDD